MMKESRKHGSRDHNGQSKTESVPLTEENELVDIHAAMMEELGIGRKDTLPLQDSEFPIHEFHFSLNPKTHVPGVDLWRNAVFNDVNPAEDEIDSIADGQLARYRRKMASNNDLASAPSDLKKHSLNQGVKSQATTDKNLLPKRKRKAKNCEPDWSSLHRIPNSPSNSTKLPTPSISTKTRTGEKTKTDALLNQLRSAGSTVEALKVNNSTKLSVETPALNKNINPAIQEAIEFQQSLRKNSSPSTSKKSPSSRKSQRSKPPSKRPVIQNSAWGALDENAFLAFAATSPLSLHSKNGDRSQPTPQASPLTQKIETLQPNPPLSQSSYKKNNLKISPASPSISSSYTVQGSPSSTKFISPSDNVKDQHETSEKNLQLLVTNFQEMEPDLSQQGQKNAMLVEKNPNFTSGQRVNIEARATIQKDASLGRPGIARLKEESGWLVIELQQYDQLVVREPISDEANIISDPMNPKYMIIYEASKNETLPCATWRICFQFLNVRNSFVEAILNFKAQRPVHKLREAIRDPLIQSTFGMEPTSQFESSTRTITLAHCTSLLDALDIETNAFYNSLIPIGVCLPEKKLRSKRSDVSTNSFEITTETLNHLSEIGDITYGSTIDKVINEDSREKTGLTTECLSNINNDLLIERFFHELAHWPERAILYQITQTLSSQEFPDVSSVKSENISQLKTNIRTLMKYIVQMSNHSLDFNQLQPEIATKLVKEITQKLTMKSFQKLKLGDKLLQIQKIITDLLAFQSEHEIPPNKDEDLQAASQSTPEIYEEKHHQETSTLENSNPKKILSDLNNGDKIMIVDIPHAPDLNRENTNELLPETPSRLLYSLNELMSLRENSKEIQEDLINKDVLLLVSPKSASQKSSLRDHEASRTSRPSDTVILQADASSPTLVGKDTSQVKKSDPRHTHTFNSQDINLMSNAAIEDKNSDRKEDSSKSPNPWTKWNNESKNEKKKDRIKSLNAWKKWAGENTSIDDKASKTTEINNVYQPWPQTVSPAPKLSPSIPSFKLRDKVYNVETSEPISPSSEASNHSRSYTSSMSNAIPKSYDAAKIIRPIQALQSSTDPLKASPKEFKGLMSSRWSTS